eukprot:3461945-Prymnesium_polylepis.1
MQIRARTIYHFKPRRGTRALTAHADRGSRVISAWEVSRGPRLMRIPRIKRPPFRDLCQNASEPF